MPHLSFFNLLALALGLSMDAFAAAVCKGLVIKKLRFSDSARVGIWFGGFQGIMPVFGWLLSVHFADYIRVCSAWIAFILLAVIGGNMIRGAMSDSGESKSSAALGFKTMLLMSLATSIDAMAVGVTFTALEYSRSEVLLSVAVIGAITFILSAVGVKIGCLGGERFRSSAEISGGVILLLLGIKILLEHFGVV